LAVTQHLGHPPHLDQQVPLGLLSEPGHAERVLVDVLGDGALDQLAQDRRGDGIDLDGLPVELRGPAVGLLGRPGGQAHRGDLLGGDGQALEVQPVLYVAVSLGGEGRHLLGERPPGVDSARVVVTELVDEHVGRGGDDGLRHRPGERLGDVTADHAERARHIARSRAG
jgi:hypothetical protein